MFVEHVWSRIAGVLFLEGRLYFYHADGNRARGSAGGPSVLLAYGAENAEILRTCPLPGAYCEQVGRPRLTAIEAVSPPAVAPSAGRRSPSPAPG